MDKTAWLQVIINVIKNGTHISTRAEAIYMYEKVRAEQGVR